MKCKVIMIISAAVAMAVASNCAIATPPKVLEMIPDNRSSEVDPALPEIRITFDQDMDTRIGYSICGGGEEYPNFIGKPKWEDNRTIVCKVKLSPDHQYSFSLNCPSSHKAFRNEQGEMLEYCSISFETGSKNDSPNNNLRYKPISILLKEGKHKEDVEGDLDSAIEIYEQIIIDEKAKEGYLAQAYYRLGMCHLKKGENEKAAQYFQEVISKYPSIKVLCDKAAKELEKIEEQSSVALFAQIPPAVMQYISDELTVISTEAQAMGLYANTHIYLLNEEKKLTNGGLGYFVNITNGPIAKIPFGGTTNTKNKYYNTAGQKLNIQITPRDNAKGYYDVVCTPDEPLAPSAVFKYGWSGNITTKLEPTQDNNEYICSMQNFFGSPVMETFFLVVPANMEITTQSEKITKESTIENWTVYYWKKELKEKTNNIITVNLKETFTPLNKIEQISLAKQAALDWLKIIDDEEYGKSWDEASSLFKLAVSQKDWGKAVSSVRGPLGKVKSRDQISADYSTQLPGAPDGEYVVLRFKTNFENAENMNETIVPMKDADGKWRISGYYVMSF